MTLLELTDMIKLIIQDASFDGWITLMLNTGVIEIAGGMRSPLGDWLTPPLPGLYTIGTVTTDPAAGMVSMPIDFQRGLTFAASEDGVEIDIENNLTDFLEVYPLLDRQGQITSVLEHGGNLYYQASPTTAETVTVHYHRLPVNMSIDTDTPDGIPDHLQRSLLVNYAAWKIYEMIEDGIEGPGENTTRYMGLFFNALKTLELTIPHHTRGMDLIHDV